MDRITVTELIEFVQSEKLQLKQPEYSINRPRRDEEWMFSNNEVPPMWSNNLINIDQPYSLGQPLLAPLSPIQDADFPRGAFRFPFEYEFDKDIIDQGVTKNSGTDALAWYRPFHMQPHEKWGITILDQGIWYLAKFIAAQMHEDVDRLYNSEQSESILSECFDVALNFLYYHELFHFKVELAATMAELNSNTAFYRKYWLNGFNSESEAIRGNSPLEEALANSFARNKALEEVPTKSRSRVRKALDSFIKSQPDGYKDAYSVRGKKTFRLGVEELISKLVNIPNPLFDTNKLILEHVFFDGIHGKEDWLDHYISQVPCRVLNTGFAGGLFSASAERLFLSEFCATKTFWKDYKKIKNNSVKEDFARAMNEWEPENSKFRTTGRDLKIFHVVPNRRKVKEFRVIAKESWRVYFEIFENGEKLLLKMHLKSDGKQKAAKKAMNKRPYQSWTIFKHHKSCEHK